MSIRHRLFLLLLLASALVVTSSYLLLRWSFDAGLLQFVEGRKAREATRLTERLAAGLRKGAWDTLPDEEAWSALIKDVGRELRGEDGDDRSKRSPEGIAGRKPPKFALLDAGQQVLVGDDPKVDRWVLSPVHTPEGVVGFVGTKPSRLLSEKTDLHFAEGIAQRFALVYAALALVCVGLAWWFAGLLTRPIQSIANGVKRLTNGDLDIRVRVTGKDELAYLGQHFNDMADRLQQSDRERREWLANAAHELRTPLGLLRAELEAIEDGVRRAENHGLGNALGACDRLENLVNDLSVLASGTAQMTAPMDQQIELSGLLKDRGSAWASALAHREITLDIDIPAKPVLVRGNRRLLEQVADNLIANWVRYTEQGGRCWIQLQVAGSQVMCSFQDSGPGVDPQLHERLFERLFRVEASRSREHGGAGLGLSICRQIVKEHGGSVQASQAPSGGLDIQVALPAGGAA